MFFGRGDEISWINKSVWKKRERQPLLLHGALGSGKTSILNQLVIDPDSRLLITIIINTPQVIEDDVRDFLWGLSQSISSALSVAEKPSPPFYKRMLVLHPIQEFKKNFWFPLEKSLREERLLLAFDNSDILYGLSNGKNPGNELLDIILDLYLETDRIEYIMASSGAFNRKQSVAETMLDDSAVLEVSNFDLDDSLDIINLLYPFRVVDSVGRYIHDLTGGHPNDLQRLCYALYERCLHLGNTHITFADIAATLTMDVGPGDFHMPVFKRRNIYKHYIPGD